MLVIADDLTGAAEIAGLGVEYGLSTSLGCGPAVTAKTELLVLDTHSRHLAALDAAAAVSRALREWATGPFDWVYKKTDSVLRGEVCAELSAMMAILGRKRSLLLPQNPSKRRVIIKGEYFIEDVPLDQTAFRHDPEHPRSTARVRDLCGTAGSVAIHSADADISALAEGITIGNAASTADLRQWAARTDEGMLLAGGADFFCAILEARGYVRQNIPPLPAPAALTLLVCGSAAQYSREQVERWAASALPVAAMPEEAGASEGDLSERWAAEARGHWAQRRHAILAIRSAISPRKASLYRTRMADTVQRLISDFERTISLHLIVEGGATAATIAGALGWDQFEIVGNMAPGVVMLRPAGAPHVTMIIKPGSYPWPAQFLERS